MAISLRDEKYRWLSLLLYGLAAFVVAVLLVFGVRWIYRSVHNNSQPTVQQPISTNETPQQPATNSPSSNTPAQGNSSTGGTSNLPNNGPGDVAAIFIGTSAAAAGLHYYIRARRVQG